MPNLKTCLKVWLDKTLRSFNDQPRVVHPSEQSINSPGKIAMTNVMTPVMTDVVIEWNNILLEAIRKTGGDPGPIARASAMMHVAMYDAINAIAKTHKPYLHNLPEPAADTSPEAAAIYAAHCILN